MNLTFHRRACVAITAVALTGCSTVESAERQAVRYNSAFSDSRNEVLLLNVLRSRYHEPVQFSTMSNVTGPMRGNILVNNPIEWAFSGAAKAAKLASGGSAFTFRDPAITITPLDSKEFWAGMTAPVKLDYFAQLLRGGDPGDATVVRALVEERSGCASRPREPDTTDVWMTGAEAAKILKEGAGEHVEAAIVPGTSRSGDKVKMRLKEKSPIVSVDSSLCTSGYLDSKLERLRSPLQMINYISENVTVTGEDAPSGAKYLYFHYLPAPATNTHPVSILTYTVYRGNTYAVPRSEANARTFSLLAQIIAYQTTNAELNASKPTVTVSGD